MIFKNESEDVQQSLLSTPHRCNLSYEEQTHLIIANFISESNLSLYGLGQTIIYYKMKGVGALIKIGIHLGLDDE